MHILRVQVEPVNDALEQVKISLFTKEFALPRERFVAQADRSVVLAAEGNKWFLRCVVVTDTPSSTWNTTAVS